MRLPADATAQQHYLRRYLAKLEFQQETLLNPNGCKSIINPTFSSSWKLMSWLCVCVCLIQNHIVSLFCCKYNRIVCEMLNNNNKKNTLEARVVDLQSRWVEDSPGLQSSEPNTSILYLNKTDKNQTYSTKQETLEKTQLDSSVTHKVQHFTGRFTAACRRPG